MAPWPQGGRSREHCRPLPTNGPLATRAVAARWPLGRKEAARESTDAARWPPGDNWAARENKERAATAPRKPNSVPHRHRPCGRHRRGDDHSSSPVITDGIKRPTRKPRTGRPMGSVAGTRAPLFGLAPCGVLPATRVATRAVRSYRTFSPLLVCGRPKPTAPVSGVFSVPLSFELPRPGVTRRTTLWSSDFPPPLSRRRSSGLLWRRTPPIRRFPA